MPCRPRSSRLDRGNATLLGAFYRASATDPKPVLVYASGFPGPHLDPSDLGYALRASGWNVITLRYRGTWGSTGTPSLVTWTEDMKAWVDYAIGDPGVDRSRIAVGGTSIGALLMASEAGTDDRVTDVLLVSPRVRRSMSAAMLADPRSPAAKGLLRLGTLSLAHVDDPVRQRLTAELIGAPSLLEVAGRLRGRRVFVASGDKDPIPTQDVVDLVESTGAQWFRYPDADHGFTRHREVLVSQVVDWLAPGRA